MGRRWIVIETSNIQHSTPNLNLCFTLALTFYPLPEERKWLLAGFDFADSRQIQSREFSRGRRMILPLLGGEGRGEDGRLSNFFLTDFIGLV
jgi:hypothetical protein